MALLWSRMRWVFHGTGGFLGRIESETRIAFWSDEPADHGFDPSLLITVDLARTPSAALLGEISHDAVEVDDCFSGPGGDVRGTTIGPRWPEIQVAGAVYLEQRFCERLPANLRPSLPPKFMGGRAYEYTTVLYWPSSDDPRAGRRYAGHHAELLEERAGLARVAVYPQGASDRPGVEPKTMWIESIVRRARRRRAPQPHRDRPGAAQRCAVPDLHGTAIHADEPQKDRTMTRPEDNAGNAGNAGNADNANDKAPGTTPDRPSRRERLHALLFAGAALGTTLLTLGGTLDPKTPPFKGE